MLWKKFPKDFSHSMHPVTFPPRLGRKSPRFARLSPCHARAVGDGISFEAGCRPLELPRLILTHLSLKKS